MNERKALVRAIFEQGWNQQEFREVEKWLTNSLQFHYRGTVFSTNLQELQQLVAQWRSAFPDLHFTIGAIVAEHDTVAVRLTYTGTHLGHWAGVAPSKRQIEVEEMMFFRFDDTSLVEAWEVQDELALLQQIGALPPPT